MGLSMVLSGLAFIDKDRRNLVAPLVRSSLDRLFPVWLSEKTYERLTDVRRGNDEATSPESA
jgi:hypothetical protein